MQRKKIITCLFLLFLIVPNVLVAGESDEVNSVVNKARTDAAIRETWNGMRMALSDNDMEKALTFIAIQSVEHYRKLFAAFEGRLPEMARELHDIRPVYIKNNSAKYRMRRSELYGGRMAELDYNVYFVVDGNGMWKIDWY